MKCKERKPVPFWQSRAIRPRTLTLQHMGLLLVKPPGQEKAPRVAMLPDLVSVTGAARPIVKRAAAMSNFILADLNKEE
jgi:hypothetical protein